MNNNPNINHQTFYDAEEDFGPIKICLKNKIVYKYDDFKCIAVLKANELVRDTRPWIYNRKLNPDNITELKAKYLLYDKVYSPLWNISIIYDETSEDIVKLYILDGQHRRIVLKELLQEGKIDADIDITCTIYNIRDCQGTNKNIATELFKKINNNLPLDLKDIPDTFVQDVVDRIIADKVLNPKNSIKIIDTNDEKSFAHEPRIHKRELYHKFNEHLVYYKDLSIDDVISNLRIIVNKIRFEDCEQIYNFKVVDRGCEKWREKYEKAKSMDFWLGLKTSVKYNPEVLIKSIADPLKFDI